MIDSAAVRAVPTVAEPTASASLTVPRPEMSERITLAIAQTAPLSLAVATFMPVETWFCAAARPLFVDFRVCRATRALELVRMLDIAYSFRRAALSTPRCLWVIPRMRNR